MQLERSINERLERLFSSIVSSLNYRNRRRPSRVPRPNHSSIFTPTEFAQHLLPRFEDLGGEQIGDREGHETYRAEALSNDDLSDMLGTGARISNSNPDGYEFITDDVTITYSSYTLLFTVMFAVAYRLPNRRENNNSNSSDNDENANANNNANANANAAVVPVGSNGMYANIRNRRDRRPRNANVRNNIVSLFQSRT